jgi:hypothetical protein
MKTQAYVDEVTKRSGHSLQVACAACRHSEFIHSDHDVRRCLYAECPCPMFQRPAPAELTTTTREAEGRKRRGPRTDWAGSSAAS